MFKSVMIILVAIVFMALGFINYAFSLDKIDNEEWDVVSAGPVTTWTAPVCGKGKFIVQPFLFFNHTRGSFNSDAHYDSLPDANKKYQFQEQLFAQYGITDKLEIDGQMVYQQNYIKQDGSNARANGFGDSYLFTRYCVFEEKGWLPHTAGLVQVKIPTGKYQHADPDKLGADLMGATSGGGSWDPGFGFNLTKKLKPFVFHADAIFSFPQRVRVDGLKTIYGKYQNYDAGIEYFMPNGFNIMFETSVFLQGDKRLDGARIPSSNINYLTVSPGIGWSCSKVQMLLAYQRVVLGTSIDANDSAVFTLVYTF